METTHEALRQGKMPLEGIRVADFSWIQAGPWVGRYFANYGAEVIKVECPSFIGHRIVDGEVVKPRPLCSYPEVARYSGTGSIDEAANFTCVETVQAHVQIEPGKLFLTSGKPYFTALIRLPHQGDWRATSAVCEGAPAVKLTRHGHSYKATFNKQDLINITAGDKVTFTVTLFVERQGRHHGHPDDTPIVFEGSDTVKVME